jgi:hypothetical protein
MNISPMQRCKKWSGLAKKSQASLENFRTASNAGMPYFIPFDFAVFFFNTIDRDRIKGLTPRGLKLTRDFENFCQNPKSPRLLAEL